MSASTPPSSTPPGSPAGSPPAVDPSMEDILASIRRILNEDEQPAVATDAPVPHVLALSEDMLVNDTPPAGRTSLVSPPPETLRDVGTPTQMPQDALLMGAGMAPDAGRPDAPPPSAKTGREHLVAPDAAAAAASSVGMLLRTLMTDREQVHVHRGGPTIEDLVREEVRDLLKVWLDVNLPPMVERLVRSEIERVVGRATS